MLHGLFNRPVFFKSGFESVAGRGKKETEFGAKAKRGRKEEKEAGRRMTKSTGAARKTTNWLGK